MERTEGVYKTRTSNKTEQSTRKRLVFRDVEEGGLFTVQVSFTGK